MRSGRLEDMVVFAQVFERSSLTRAARALGSTRSAVSKSIARLEDHLGTRLLQRTTRQLSATAAGHAYYLHCARIVAEVKCAERTASELRARPKGLLRVNCALSLGILLAPALPRFALRYPEVTLQLELSESLVDLVGAAIDVGVRLGRLPDSNLVGRKLASYRRLVCASPAYLAARGTPRTPADLADHNCLTRVGHDRWGFRAGRREEPVRVAGSYRADTPELLRQAALAGLGVTLLPSFLLEADLRAGRLAVVLERFESPPAAIFAVYPHQQHLSPNARAFVDFLVEEIAAAIGGET
jgi:DNA-binding transcriptional LysR family regulator